MLVTPFLGQVPKSELHFVVGKSFGFTVTSLQTHQQQTALENIVGKGEIAHHKQFLLFPQCFLLNQIIVSPYVHSSDTTSLFAAELEEP